MARPRHDEDLRTVARETVHPSEQGARGGARLALRLGIPLALVACGIVVLALGGATAAIGIFLIGAAPIVLLVNVYARVTAADEREREREERARRYLSTHGSWPGEASR